LPLQHNGLRNDARRMSDFGRIFQPKTWSR
jgi:hypothetical protein